MSYGRYKMCEDPSEKQALNLPFTGICSFAKYPICTNLDELDADVAIMGIPFDLTTQWRSGTNMGPRGLRDASTLYSLGMGGAYDPERDDIYLAPPAKIADCGDSEIVHGDTTQCLENAEKMVRKIVNRGAMPVVLGGDHAITIPVAYGLEDVGPFNVIQIDAHLDWANIRSGQRWGQGSPMRRLSEMDHVKKMWQIGIRGVGGSKRPDFEDARNYGDTIISPKELRTMGIQNLIEQFPKGEKYYVTFDIDGLDISIASGTGTPSPGGLLYDEVIEIFEGIAKRGEIIGFDLVEVAPCYDLNQSTCILASRMILDFISFILKEREKKGLLKGQIK